MTKPRKALTAIHQLERSIRILELARDRMQGAANRAIASYENQGAETTRIAAKRRAFIAASNKAILRAKAQLNELLEKGE